MQFLKILRPQQMETFCRYLRDNRPAFLPKPARAKGRPRRQKLTTSLSHSIHFGPGAR